MGWCSPGEYPDKAVLKDEEYSDSSIETAEVVGHEREREPWPVDIFSGPFVNIFWR